MTSDVRLLDDAELEASSVVAGYLGADDRAGPNYTGQPAVCSYYTVPLTGK